MAGLKPRLSVFKKLKKKAEKGLEELVKAARNKYPNTTLILFGPRARGENLPYSDWDIAVIVECRSPIDKLRISEEMYRLKPPAMPLDPIIICRSELNDPLVARMLEESKILYNGLNIKWEKAGERAVVNYAKSLGHARQLLESYGGSWRLPCSFPGINYYNLFDA
ncbi:MAG: hypothetical protein DSY37_00500 [Hyperthermus sp.]|nr:MAG: hypothetical protein DSY37_00500 [Hyperthermus sp.]